MTYHGAPILPEHSSETAELLDIFYQYKSNFSSSWALNKRVRELVLQGGDLNALDSNESSVFMSAADPSLTPSHEYKEWIEFLMLHNANIAHQNKGGFGAFYWAYNNANIEHLTILFECGVPAFQETNEHGSVMRNVLFECEPLKFSFMLDKWLEHQAALKTEPHIIDEKLQGFIQNCEYAVNDWIPGNEPMPDFLGCRDIIKSTIEKNILDKEIPVYHTSNSDSYTSRPNPHIIHITKITKI